MRRAALRPKHQRKGLLVLSCVAGLVAAFVATPSPAAQKTAQSQQAKIWALGVSAAKVPSVQVARLQWLRRRGIQALVVNAASLSPQQIAKLTDRAAHSGMLVIAARGSLRPGACPGSSSTLQTCAVIAQSPREAVRLTKLDSFDYVVFYVHDLQQVNYLRGANASHTQLLAIVPSHLARTNSRQWQLVTGNASQDSALDLTIRTAPAASPPVMNLLDLLRHWRPRLVPPKKTPSPAPPAVTNTATTTPVTTTPDPPTTTAPPTTTTPPPTTTTPPPTTTTPPPPTTTTDTQPPSAPKGLAVTGSSQTSISISWSASSDNVAVTGYDLYRNGTSAGTTSATSRTFSGLSCGTSYTLGVDAFDAVGNKSTASTISASTAACPDTQAPTAPTGLTVTGSTATSISVSWNAAFDNVGVAGYDVYNGSTVAGTTSTFTSYTVSGLSCGTSYTVAVDAFDAAGNKSTKASLTSSTAACSDTQAPTTPTGLIVTGSTATSVSVSWSAAFDNVGVTGYDVYNGSTIAGTTSTFTSYTVSGLSCGTSYTVAVDAFDAAGNKSGKTSLTTSTAACPTSLASVTFNSPGAGSTVSGSIIWSVQPTVAFDHVNFIVDGGAVGWTETTCPCYYNGDPNGRLDTTTLTNGTHTLTAKAYNAGGTEVAESSESVTVNNAAPAPPPTTTTTPTTTTPAPTGTSCFASPGSCGYPDPAYGNVGVPAGTNLTPSGSITVSTAGTVINGLNVTGEIDVNANNVTIQNTKVTMTGGGCGPTNTCANSDIHVLCDCNVTVSHVELTTDSSTTVEHAIRNSYGGFLTVDHVYQHGNADALCWCGDANISDSYSTIHLAISNDHLENTYTDGDTDTMNHNTFLNATQQTANIFANTNNGTGGTCSNHLTVTNNLLAGGGYTIYPCGNASSAGSSSLTFTDNRIARCGGGNEVSGPGGTWLCSDAPKSAPYLSTDGHGWFPRGGSYGYDANIYCGSSTWTRNVWDDSGATINC
jgi:chitodextrinase